MAKQFNHDNLGEQMNNLDIRRKKKKKNERKELKTPIIYLYHIQPLKKTEEEED